MLVSTVTIHPAQRIHGTLRLPGDKSISHRYAMLAALAEGKCKFINFSNGADCASTLKCLRSIGVEIESQNGVLQINGRAGKLGAPQVPLNCGNSGSTMRMLAGILAAQNFTSELIGDESLSRRPMARIINPLSQMGATVQSAKNARPPLRIEGAGKELRGIDYQMPVASAQVKSSILFAGLLAQGKTRVTEAVRTRDHGELALRAFGAEVERSLTTVTLRGGQSLRAIEATIPGDISSAAFFLCGAAILPGSSLVIEDLLLNPTRAALLDVLMALGARIQVVEMSDHHGELVGTVKIEAGTLKGAKISGGTSAILVDELPVLTAIAPYTTDGIEIRDAAELRLKESDRIAAVANNLHMMGAQLEEFPDGIRIPGGQKLHGANLDSAGDHRIAMAFSVAALRASGATVIHGSEAVAISFPEFFQLLRSVAED